MRKVLCLRPPTLPLAQPFLLSEVVWGIKAFPVKHQHINCGVVRTIETTPPSHFPPLKLGFSRNRVFLSQIMAEVASLLRWHWILQLLLRVPLYLVRIYLILMFSFYLVIRNWCMNKLKKEHFSRQRGCEFEGHIKISQNGSLCCSGWFFIFCVLLFLLSFSLFLVYS